MTQWPRGGYPAGNTPASELRPPPAHMVSKETVPAGLQAQRCQHPQAEPVVLSTGEQVACVCIGCYEQLPADHIKRQAEAAHREAHCDHTGAIEVTAFGKADRHFICNECGSWVSNCTWPTMHPPTEAQHA